MPWKGSFLLLQDYVCDNELFHHHYRALFVLTNLNFE